VKTIPGSSEWTIEVPPSALAGSVYEDSGPLTLRVKFPSDYPVKPPQVYFLRPAPRHPHVYSNGDICLNLLGADWRPNLTVDALVVSILSMLTSAKEKKVPLDNALRKLFVDFWLLISVVIFASTHRSTHMAQAPACRRVTSKSTGCTTMIGARLDLTSPSAAPQACSPLRMGGPWAGMARHCTLTHPRQHLQVEQHLLAVPKADSRLRAPSFLKRGNRRNRTSK
jgi:hypothetical protein